MFPCRSTAAQPPLHHREQTETPAAAGFKTFLAVVVACALAAPGGGQITVSSAAPDVGEDDDWYTTPTEECVAAVPYLRRLNALAGATLAADGAAAVLCAWAILHIYAYRRDQRSLTTRLVLGMLLANLVYAGASVAATRVRHLSGPRCGKVVVSGDRRTDVVARCFPAALVVFGVWTTTMYELMMVLLSTHALRSGTSSVPQRAERALHALCVGAGVAALLGYYLRCRDLELRQAALIAAADYTRTAMSVSRLQAYHELGRAHAGLRGVLWGWALGPAALATLGWVYQRLLYRELLKDWERATARHDDFEEADAMAMLGLDPQSETRSKLLALRKGAYADVVKPLEPYVVVIILFMIPQAIAVSKACQLQTGDTRAKGEKGDSDAALPCDYSCALALAFRTMALALVYLSRSNRSQLLDVAGLFRRAWARLRAAAAGGCGAAVGGRSSAANGGQVRFEPSEIDGMQLVPTDGEGRSHSFGNADHDIVRMGAMASLNLTELDLASADRADANAAAALGHLDSATMDPEGSLVPYHRME